MVKKNSGYVMNNQNGSKICVFAASSSRAPQAYLDAAGELGIILARNNITVVYGGGSAGLMGKLAAFGGVAEFPVRVKCATLAWHAMNSALNSEKPEISTE